jgi:hypothetical protein
MTQLGLLNSILHPNIYSHTKSFDKFNSHIISPIFAFLVQANSDKDSSI